MAEETRSKQQMDLSEIRARLDEERRGLVRRGATVDVLPELTRVHFRSAGHMIEYSHLTAENAEAVIDREVEHHRALGVGFEWKHYDHDALPDLPARLQRRGFEIGDREAVMVAEVSAAHSWWNPVPELPVVRVETPEQVAIFRQVSSEAFGKDYSETAEELLEGIAAGSPEHLGYVAYVGGEPAAVGRLYTHPDSRFAGLYGGGTRPAYRGRGCYRAVVAARARDAQALGARWLQVDALPTSRPILERMGFQRLTDTWPCEWSPETPVRENPTSPIAQSVNKQSSGAGAPLGRGVAIPRLRDRPSPEAAMSRWGIATSPLPSGRPLLLMNSPRFQAQKY